MKWYSLVGLIVLCSCTYTINLVHTQGSASDVVDEEDTPTATVSPTVNLPKGIQ